jgi:hypothetical protein
LAFEGQPIQLPRSGGWLIARPIPGCEAYDAVGCYPVLACEDWSALATDLADLDERFVSMVAVTDPFGDWDDGLLATSFPARHGLFKQHYVVDLTADPRQFVHAHHRRNARKALAAVEVELVMEPLPLLAEWQRLYQVLRDRHQVKGVTTFPGDAFLHQLLVPGMVALVARAEGQVVGMVLWLISGDRAYYHLGAYDETGYALGASFAIFSTAITVFASQVRWLCLGAGAGLVAADDGLSRFKAGWSTGVRPVYLCGRIGQPALYHELSGMASTSGYFPAYR